MIFDRFSLLSISFIDQYAVIIDLFLEVYYGMISSMESLVECLISLIFKFPALLQYLLRTKAE